jgi:hypothetical protein
VTAVGIFRSAFAKVWDAGRTADPEWRTAALGFVGPSIKTLGTGCDIDMYFIDASTAQIALDGTIFTLKKLSF